MNGILFGVTPLDPFSIAVVVGVLVLAAALANLIPAARAARTEPQMVLRGD
jgi:ABC-type lipoprotein release transport system permease subunit